MGTGVFGQSSHAFIYTNGRSTDLGTLGGTYSEGWGINSSGQAVGHADISRTLPDHHAVLYNHGVNVDLGTFGGSRSMANSINDIGQIVGEAGLIGDSTTHAFLYSNNQLNDLGTLGGLISSAAFINESGQVVGSAEIVNRQSHAFFYIAGVMTDLGTFSGATSSAVGINDYGQVVGSAAINDTLGHAFIFSDGRMTDLNDLIESNSGWVLNWGININNKGQIAGNGMMNGVSRAFLLTMDTTAPAGVYETKKSNLIKSFKLEQNYPNPFNPTTTIQYSLIQSSSVKLIVYNLLGQKVKTIINSFHIAGEYSVVWDGKDESNMPVSSGVYFYKLETNENTLVKKMILDK